MQARPQAGTQCAHGHLLAPYRTDHFTLQRRQIRAHKVTNIDLKTSDPIGGRQVQIARGSLAPIRLARPGGGGKRR